MNRKNERSLDVVVYGAASFVGQLLTRYLAQRHGNDGTLKWALAGRNRDKLEAVAREFNLGQLPLIVADAGDQAALTQMAARTRVVASTVGPYALYGSDLVAACAEQGTDYCDLTGEPQWMQRMIDAHEARARASGARIVHNCGFDSIPSDLGVWFTQQQALKDFGEPCVQVKLRVRKIRGGFSGGTVASLLNVVKEIAHDPALRKLLQNPYAVCPADARSGVRQPNVTRPVYDEDAQSWLAPFVMAGINTKVVHRSNALQNHAWGKDFLYDEATMVGGSGKGALIAAGMAAGMGGFMALAAIGPTRTLLERYVLPKPGEGPSPEAQEKGFFDIRLFGRTASGKTLQTQVTGDRDPGYGSTSKMLGEAALCLAQDGDRTRAEGGFWTPSVCMDGALVERLTAHAGLRFERVA
ncbi:saccharopine dehydrogenase NADP-binding domain-containing protein [Fontimonas sp. SYSU GA230001]|uniref:saccharopine dehydrogenase family protein n=1 Tax=Fontimonas sp. SYSU GA230001 TaxID=3142450 RepID=UPI0032B546D8